MRLFRRSMGTPRNLDPSPEFASQFHDLLKSNAREQNAAIVRAIQQAEAAIIRKLEKIMHSLDETLALVTDQNTQVKSLITLTSSLHQKVIEAMGAGLTPSQQMRIDAIFDAVRENADAVSAAIKENTVEASAGAISDGASASDIKSQIAGTNTGVSLGDGQSGSAGGIPAGSDTAPAS